MIQLGKYNNLKISKVVDFGLYLRSDDDEEEILLPSRYVPQDYKVGDDIEVFVYNDSEDRRIATTEKPLAIVGEFAFLQVISANKVGAFLDWGLPKDLFVPFREQKSKMQENRSYPVFIYVDYDSDRIVASAKLDKFLDNVPADYQPGEVVDIFITEKTDLGYKVIVNNLHWGIIYENEIFEPVAIGDEKTGFIKKIRDDEKIDISLYESGYDKVADHATSILDKLKENNGFLSLNDKSSPDDVYQQFGFSKKVFKKALGQLYKNRVVVFEKDGIRFTGDEYIPEKK